MQLTSQPHAWQSARGSRAPLRVVPARAAGRANALGRLARPTPQLGAGRSRARTLVQTATVEAPPTPVQDVPAPAEQSAEPEQFNWYKAWYPLMTLDSLKPGRPNAAQLLGMNLVVWRPPKEGGAWSVLEDACPHRLAPVSEGRIHDDGNLMCSYHGWTFDGAGACKSIPQLAGDAKAHATACSSGRACVRRFPCKEMFGLLWVWADAGPAAWAESEAAAPSAAPPEMVSGEWTPKQPWFMRDVPVSIDTLVENICDPSHVQFSHHGVIGSRYAPADSVATLGDVTCNGGFATDYTGAGARVSRVAFSPPCLSRWHFEPDIHMLLYAVPTRMGWTRVYQNMAGPRDSKKERPPIPGIPKWLNPIINVMSRITWLQHATQHNHILDGDDYFIHKGERRLYSKGDHSSWAKQYYMPASTDAGVIGWRRWVDRFGGALPLLPRGPSDLPPLMEKWQMYDRYHQHTENCPHCMGALRAINAAIGLLAAAAAVALGTAVSAAVSGAAPLLSPLCGGAAAAGAACGAAVAGLLKFRQLFVYYEYDHNDR